MTIEFSCTCGKTLRAPEGSSGRRAKCPKCGATVTVPALAASTPEPDGEYDLSEQAPRPAPRPPTVSAPAAPHPLSSPTVAASVARSNPALVTTPGRRSLRSFSYILLFLAMIPLIISSFQPREDVDDKFQQSIDAHPAAKIALTALAEKKGITDENIDQDEAHSISPDEILALLPGNRLDGALFSRDTLEHWPLALGFAVGYFIFLLLAFPGAPAYFRGMLVAGIFTGTIGVLLLLGFQWASTFDISGGFHMGGRAVIIYFIIKLIGLSYSLADDPASGFFLSFIGFTCGVGLCEEITKALPLLYRIKERPLQKDATWNTMLLWGLASGIGFGIAEGIMYSGRYYNGIEGTGMYMVRFFSCVVLHAMWAGAVGITIYRRQSWLTDAGNGWLYSLRVVLIVLIPMVLHGLYDTLLKLDHEIAALAIAAITFAWLTIQIELQQRKEPLAVMD